MIKIRVCSSVKIFTELRLVCGRVLHRSVSAAQPMEIANFLVFAVRPFPGVVAFDLIFRLEVGVSLALDWKLGFPPPPVGGNPAVLPDRTTALTRFGDGQ